MSEPVAFHLYCDHPKDSFFKEYYKRNDGQQLNQLNGMRTEKLLCAIGENVADLVGRIVTAKGAGRIKLIRMASHGDSGGYDFCGMVNINVVASSNEHWRDLQQYMIFDARLELHGCGIASDTTTLKSGMPLDRPPVIADALPGTFSGASSGQGLQYLRKVREGFNAQVVAAVNVQLQLDDLMMEWQADTVTVFPDGQFQYNPVGVRRSDRDATEKLAHQWRLQIGSEFINHKKYQKAAEMLRWLMNTFPQTPDAGWARDLLYRSEHGGWEEALHPMQADP